MSVASPVKPLRRDSLETRRQIVDAAEELFAEHGVDNVTLLDIARASGQKNRNAPQYHFGDKEGVINAVLDKHSDLISARRKLMIEALRSKKIPSLRELVEAYVLPVAQHVEHTDNSQSYLLLHCQLMTSGYYAAMTQERASRYPEVLELTKMMRRAMVAINAEERESKILLIQTMVFHGLAGFYAATGRHQKSFTETLCASVEAVLKI